METKPVINIINLQCQPELDERLNKWVNQTHVPMLFEFKGMKQASTYRKTGVDKGTPTEYLLIQEFESQQAFEQYNASPELAAAAAESKESWEEPNVSYNKTRREQYEHIKTWKR